MVMMMIMIMRFWQHHSFMIMRKFESVMRMRHRHSVSYRNRISRKQRVRKRHLDRGDRCCWRVRNHDRLNDRMGYMWDIMSELVGRQR